MKPLSSPLQQYWQTVVERLPEPLAEESLAQGEVSTYFQ